MRRSNWKSFSLRSALLLMMLIAGLCAVWMQYFEPQRDEQRRLAELHNTPAVWFTCEQRGPAALVSNDYGWRVVYASAGGRELELSHVKKFTRFEYLETVHIVGAPQFKRPALKALVACRSIKSLYLDGAGVRGSDLQLLQQLPRLNDLQVNTGKLSDKGWRHLGRLQSLKSLTIRGDVQDCDLPHLRKLTGLRSLCCISAQTSSSCLALDAIVRCNFRAKTLPEIVKYLAGKHSFAIQLDAFSLQAAGIDVSGKRMTVHRRISLQELLRRILRPFGLVVLPLPDNLLVTTSAVANRHRTGVTALQRALPQLKISHNW